MAAFSEKVDRDKLDNFISVSLGQKFFIDGLQDYIFHSMRRIHEQVLQKLPAGFCGTNCSRKYGPAFSKWCNICRCWKDELYKLCRYKKQWKEIYWNEIDTIDFPHKTPDSYEAVAKVFISRACWVAHCRRLFSDLGAIMSLFWNVNTFSNISNNVISDIRAYRNFCYGHNYTSELDDADKNRYLSAFIKLLEVPDVLCMPTAETNLEIIKELLVTDGIPPHILLHKEVLSVLIMIGNSVQESQESVDSLSMVEMNKNLRDRINELIEDARRTHWPTGLPYRNVVGTNIKNIAKITLLIVIAIMLVCAFCYGIWSQADTENKGCMSMRFLKEWKSDIHFDFYVESLYNESFVERHWLKTALEEKINTSSRGVLITADMGYGKSSFVSNLLCAEPSSIWYDLKKHILAYHFCRHDLVLSAGAHTFIRNLAGAIVDRYPEMGNAILLDEIASDFLSDVKCAKDSVGCLEIGILAPLRNRWTQQTLLIVIDALDECDTGGGNTLLELLAKQIQKFPSNVKFVLTSRNLEYISRKFHEIHTLHINASNENNIRDIRQYIQSTTNLTDNHINTLISIAGGNFQHVKHYLRDCNQRKNCDFTYIPDSLEKLYEENFNRIFTGDNSLFDDLTPVFEVLCTLQKPLYEEQLMSIANVSVKEERRKLEQLLGNELGHFIKKEKGHISFIHKSISDFLTNESRNHSKFFIHKENGHKLFAEYIFRSLNTSYTGIDSLADLVFHVAMSFNFEFETTLNGYVKFLIKTDPLLHEILLFRVAHNYNDYRTMNLILAMNDFKGINSVNERNHSLAFIAAGQGNDDSLKCLLDRGANPNFRVIFDTPTFDKTTINQSIIIEHSVEIGFNGGDIVFLCKYFYFCGYNLLQIAAQYGHTKVVKMLLDRHKNLLYVKNDMHLNAFHLAVENGHLEIIHMLLKHDPSFADVYSLYQASKNGHLSVAQLLISRGVNDICLPCSGTFYWIADDSNRKQNAVKIRSFKSGEETLYIGLKMNTSFFDDWRLITCESALNVAVRSGHFEIVQVLAAQTQNALDCKMFDGKTPLMTAVQYNRTDIFKYLYPKAERDILSFKCLHTYDLNDDNLYLFLKLDISERRKLTAEQCPSGATIVHLLAMYGNSDMLIFMYQTGFSNWDLKDSQEATPLHYAFCHNNIDYIMAAQKLALNFSARTLNGSTVFHSAAVCRSFALYIFFKRQDAYRMEVPDTLDKEGRSILHYSMLLTLGEEDNQIVQFSTKKDWNCYALFHVCIESKHDLHRLDNKGQNFLHYAAKSGNFIGLVLSKQMMTDDDFHQLLNQKDHLGRTPFDEFFYSMPRHESYHVFKIPSGCNIKDLFYTNCRSNHELILSNHEMGIWEISKYVYDKREFSLYNITNMLLIAIHKSRIYPVLILKTYAKDLFEAATFNNPELLNVITEYEGPNIAEFILTKENALNCNGSFSPLHKIIMNDKNAIRKSSGVNFLNYFLAEYTSKILDECFDSYGYNLLHRAVIGGNILAVKYLVVKGMNTSRSSRAGVHPLVLSITKAPYLENSVLPSYYTNSSMSQVLQYEMENNITRYVFDERGPVDFDETSTFIVQTEYTSKTFNRTLFVGLLCKSSTKQLGLIHLSAAKGFIKFLKKCKELFGADKLNCEDFYHITPLYLAKLYNQTRVANWMRNVGVHLVRPGLEIKNLLIYNFLSNYRTVNTFHWICRLQYSYKHKALIINQLRICLPYVKESDSVVVYKSIFDILGIKYLHNISRLIYPFDNGNTMDPNRYCDLNLELCSLLVETANLHVRQLKARHRHVYLLFRKFMKFGFSDNMFWFQHIQGQILKQNPLKYIKAFSFHSIFSFHYRYLEQLKMQSEMHRRWLFNRVQDIEKESQINYLGYTYRQYKLALRINSELSNSIQVIDKTLKTLEKKIQTYEANQKICQKCDFFESALATFSDMCSVYDLYKIEFECIEKNTHLPPLFEAEINISNTITALVGKARNDSAYRKKFKLFQRKALMFLYFMQYIPEKRRTSPCMKLLKLTAERVAAVEEV